MPPLAPLALAVLSLLACPALLRAEEAPAAPLFDPRQLPAFTGRVELFTLTPRGDIDGFVLTDGTEVKTPPHLTRALQAIVRPGDAVTVHGLKAASLPLVQALSVTNAATGRTVVDAGPEGPGRPPPPPLAAGAPADVSVLGRVRLVLHGPRGDVNGVLLEDGSVLRLPPGDAAELGAVLVPGHPVAARAVRRMTGAGALFDVQAIGPSPDRMTPLGPGPRPPA